MILKIIKKTVLLSLALSIQMLNKESNATIFDEHTYGRARAYIGFANQFSQFKENKTKNKINFGVPIGIGYNIYFNIYDNLHPFVGLEAQGIIPIKKQEYFSSNYDDINDVKRLYKEVFLTHLKLGSRFVLTNILSLSPYGLIGFNVSRIEYNYHGFEKVDNTIGLNVGCGGEITINDLLLIAFEYRYSHSEKRLAKIDNHTIGIKIGIEFL